MDLGSLAQMGQNMLKNSGGNDNASNAVTALVPKEVLDKLPPAVRTIATSQAVDAVAKQAPELFEIISKGGKLTGSDAEKVKSIVMSAFSAAGK